MDYTPGLVSENTLGLEVAVLLQWQKKPNTIGE